MAKMASSARVVCWQNREEWLYVYRALYNFDNPDIQRQGIDRVAAWKSRSAGKLPLAIECTANLVSSQLVVNSVGHEIQGRLTLGMAIVRFVNGMVDQFQKGKFARSVQTIADEIGLPDWLVDLRHEATHASLPSMETLQSGLEASLCWLQEEYWEEQINMHEENEQKLLTLLNKYRDVAFSCPLKKKAKLKSSSKVIKLSNEIASIVSESNLWSLLPSILSSEEMMVPSHEQLKELGITWLSQNSSSDFLISDIPKEILKIWKTLLKTLNKSSSDFNVFLIIHFLEELSANNNNQTQVSPSHCLAAWVKHLLQEQSGQKPSMVTKSNFPWVNILHATLENPSLYSADLIPLILKNLPMVSMEVKEKIEHLVSAFVNLECSQSDIIIDESLPFDLEQCMRNEGNTSTAPKTREPGEDNNHAGIEWQISKGLTQWQLIPFGEVLGTSDMSPCNLLLVQPSLDASSSVTDLEYQNELENTDVVATDHGGDAIFIDSSNTDDEMSCDHNNELQPSANINVQERGSSEMPLIYVDSDEEYSTEIPCAYSFEGKNDTISISKQIYLF